MKLYVKFLLVSVGIKCLSMFILQNFLNYVNFFFLVGVVCWTIYRLFKRNLHLTLKKCLLIFCMFVVIAIPSQTMSFSKFYLLEPLYQHSAEQIAEEIADADNTYFEEIQLSIPQRILLNNCEKSALYQKHGDYYAISFIKQQNFFQCYAYVYFSEPEAITLVTNPANYWSGYDDGSAYDTIIWLAQNKWALVKYY